jgi:hypothetical protein
MNESVTPQKESVSDVAESGPFCSSARPSTQPDVSAAVLRHASRTGFLKRVAAMSLGNRLIAASAAVFVAAAARGTDKAYAIDPQCNWICCCLAYTDSAHWCVARSWTNPPYECPAGSYQRVWYCCGPGGVVGCGECQSGSGTCHDGPDWYCSYGWYTGAGC